MEELRNLIKNENFNLRDVLDRELITLDDIETALLGAKAICDSALPKFNWKDSALDADAITALNLGGIAIAKVFNA